eukprot:TRINITY_DN1297_c0_g1_i11.p1 TRINITY_DN1297_c0_g1~~TRINITY_DN1297_c0_g1_i11.p1  ORF type:complete len:343 (-),score=59.10 TRINITY_DN1297_c0_g1_i11:260-1288(-)
MCFTAKKKDKATIDIDKELKQAQKERGRHVTLLLLGAGESGKSTFAKQLKVLHASGFNDSEKSHYCDVILDNITYSVQQLLSATEAHHLELTEKNRKFAQECQNLYKLEMNPAMGASIKSLTEDPAIVKVRTEHYTTFHLPDSAIYFLSNIERISTPGYIPSVEDLLRCRVRTTGIQELEITTEGITFTIVDVGGQRSERKKWVHCFENITAIIFLVAMSEYDLNLFEDQSTNRMHESLKLFDEICSSKWFTKTPVILFLNKRDLFAEKIKKTNITTAFPEYSGPQTYEATSAYIRDQFVCLTENTVYPHFTCATDTKNVNQVFNSVREMFVNAAMEQIGIV